MLSKVDAVRRVPRLGVHRAVGSVRDICDTEEVGIDEVACIVGAIGASVAAVVGCGGFASGDALVSIIRAGEVLCADEGAGSFDGTAESHGAVKARERRRCVVLAVACVFLSDGDSSITEGVTYHWSQ